MLGDLQEDHVYDKRLCGYASRCQLSLFPVPIPVSPSTKSGFLCSFGLRDPRFRAFRAQNRGFCALLGSGTPVFGLFEHKIKVFVRFWASEPLFSGISSTKSRFLCADYHEMAIGKRQTAIGIVVGWWHRGVVTASLASGRRWAGGLACFLWFLFLNVLSLFCFV